MAASFPPHPPAMCLQELGKEREQGLPLWTIGTVVNIGADRVAGPGVVEGWRDCWPPLIEDSLELDDTNTWI